MTFKGWNLLLLKGLTFSSRPKKLRFEEDLLPFELLHRDVFYDLNDINDSLIRLKSKIKDVSLSSFRLYNEKDYRFENLSEKKYEAFINLRRW